MALSDVAIRRLKPTDKKYKQADALGLSLIVTPAGGKLWRFKYRIDGREKSLSIGSYPDVSLADARRKRDEARAMVASGKDPSREKQREKRKAQVNAEHTFKFVAEEFCRKRVKDGSKGWSPATAKRCEYLLSQFYPAIGPIPVTEIEPADVLSVLRKIEAKGALESARRSLQLAGMVFRHAVSTARLASDPTRDLKGALTTPTVRHHSAITDPESVGPLLRAIRDDQSLGLVGYALELLARLYVRPGELRHADWSEFDFENSVWTIPAQKMKMRKPHTVPLSRQSLALLRELKSLTGPDGYVLPSVRSRTRPLSENTFNAALRRLGYSKEQMTAHGFRAMASTLLNESGKWSPDAIERSLAHADGDKVRAAYHRGAHWNERVEMSQWWSDYLDELAHLDFRADRNAYQAVD